MIHSPFIMCNICHRISKIVSPIEKTNLSSPLPCCGSTGESRVTWPSLECLLLINTVMKQDLNNREQRNIAIVFMATLLEMLVEKSVFTLIRKNTSSIELIEATMSSYRGRKKLIELFDRLSTKSMRKLITESGYSSFISNWDQLATTRNKIVHGSMIFSSTNDKEIVESVLKEVLEVFSLVHNHTLHNESKAPA